MRFGALGPRGLKLYMRNGIIFLIASLLWWASAELFTYLCLGKLGFWLSLPFWLVVVISILGIYSIGPLGKGFREAVIADENEEKLSLKSKQPWE
jgi:hypothetical protein